MEDQSPFDLPRYPPLHDILIFDSELEPSHNSDIRQFLEHSEQIRQAQKSELPLSFILLQWYQVLEQ